MIQVFRVLNDQHEIFREKFLELSKRPGRKNTLKLFKRRCSLDLCKYGFTSRVVGPWNYLPDADVLSADVKTFKINYEHVKRDSRGQVQAIRLIPVLMTTCGGVRSLGGVRNK